MSAIVRQDLSPEQEDAERAAPLTLVHHPFAADDPDATQVVVPPDYERPDTETAEPSPTDPVSHTPAPEPKTPGTRLLSLDAFRGLTILGMLAVNNIAMGEATPDQMTHAEMGHVHLADCVFPWFLLIVGIAIPYAAASRRDKGVGYGPYLLKALGRTVTLVLLGCLLDSSILHRPVFDLNVLQLIGLAYFVAVLAYALPLAARLPLAFALLAAHWYILTHVSVPGVGRGVLTETQNVVAYWNHAYLARYHLAGLTSVIPTAALALIGTALGDLLRSERLAPIRRCALLVVAGVALAALGMWWGRSLPMSKPLWTASFILYMAGWGSLALAGFYAILDVLRWRAWAFPLLVFGSNAIFAYVVPILTKVFILQSWTVPGPSGSSMTLQQFFLTACAREWTRAEGGAAYTAFYILFWWLILLWLYRRRVFLRV